MSVFSSLQMNIIKFTLEDYVILLTKNLTGVDKNNNKIPRLIKMYGLISKAQIFRMIKRVLNIVSADFGRPKWPFRS